MSSSHYQYISQRTVKYWLITLHFLCSQTNKQRIPTSHPVSTEKIPTIFGSSRVFLGQKLPHHNSLPGVENFNSPNTRMLCFVYWFSRMVTVWSDAFQSDPLISGVDGQTVNKSCPLASRGWREVLEKRCSNPSWFKQEAQEAFFFLVEGRYIFLILKTNARIHLGATRQHCQFWAWTDSHWTNNSSQYSQKCRWFHHCLTPLSSSKITLHHHPDLWFHLWSGSTHARAHLKMVLFRVQRGAGWGWCS